MPGNIIQINNSDDLRWYVGDSKMQKLICFLNEVGFKKSTNKELGKELKEFSHKIKGKENEDNHKKT